MSCEINGEIKHNLFTAYSQYPVSRCLGCPGRAHCSEVSIPFPFPQPPATAFGILKRIKDSQSVNHSITNFIFYPLYLNFDKQHMKFYLFQQN